MKIIFLATILSLLLPLSAFATSGACSYHSGVNCGYGPDYDGSIVCYDGWKESNVSYLSSAECQAQISCTTSELNTLLEKYNVPNLRAQYDALISQINLIKAELQAALVAVEAKPITMNSIISQQNRLISDANNQISPLSFQAEMIRNTLNTNLVTVKTECRTMGENRINELTRLRLQQYLEEQTKSRLLEEQLFQEQVRKLEQARLEQERQIVSAPPVAPTTVTPVQPAPKPVDKVVQKPVKPIQKVVTSKVVTTTAIAEPVTSIEIFKEPQTTSKFKRFWFYIFKLFR